MGLFAVRAEMGGAETLGAPAPRWERLRGCASKSAEQECAGGVPMQHTIAVEDVTA